MRPWRLLLRRPLVEFGAFIVAATGALLIAARDRVRPPRVVPRKESEYEGLAFRVPAEW